MAEDHDPLVDEEDEETIEEDLVSEEELPESPALADHSIETLSPGGVTYERGPNGKLTPKVD